jgi:hypothetical protein
MPAALVAIPLVSLPTPLPFGIQVSAPIFGLVAALAVFADGLVPILIPRSQFCVGTLPDHRQMRARLRT